MPKARARRATSMPTLSQAHDAEGLASQFGALKRFLLPLPGMHQFIGAADVASHGQHQRQRVLGHGNGIGAGSVHDRDAFAGGGIQVDVVDAHAGASDHPQLAGMLQQFGVHLHRRADDQRVGRLQLRGQFAVDLIGA